MIRTQADPLALAASVRSVIRAMDPHLVVTHVQSMQDEFKDCFKSQRFTMFLAVLFAVCAFVLSITGLYGMLSYRVKGRSREIAIRMATGAAPGDITRLVCGQGAKILVLGLTVGFVAVLALTKIVIGYIYGISPLDGLTLGGALVLIVTISLLVSYIPARRAARIDPVEALRYE